MRVAILGAAHPHVEYALEEVAHRADLELVAAAEPDAAMREQFLGPLTDVPVYDGFADLGPYERNVLDSTGLTPEETAEAVLELHGE